MAANSMIWKRMPKKQRNLWHDANYRNVRFAMQERLIDRMAWTVDALPERQAPW